MTKLDTISITLMMMAAVESNFLVLAMRPAGTSVCSSAGPPRINGITETPVSKPLKPSASRGKIRPDAMAIAVQSPRRCSDWFQLRYNSGWFEISIRHRASTTTFNNR